MTGLRDPSRYLAGGEPQAVLVPARVARALDRAVLDDFRKRARGMDSELDAVLAALHIAGLQYADTPGTSRTGSDGLPTGGAVPRSAHDLLDVGEVARRLGCGRRNVVDLHHRGRLAGHKVAGRLLFAPETVDGYLADRAS